MTKTVMRCDDTPDGKMSFPGVHKLNVRTDYADRSFFFFASLQGSEMNGANDEHKELGEHSTVGFSFLF